MRRQPRATVQPFKYKQTTDPRNGARVTTPKGAEIRLRGAWVLEVFPVGQKLRIVRQLQAGRVALMIEAER